MTPPVPVRITLPQEALNLLREVLFYLQGGGKETQAWLVGGTLRDLVVGRTDLLDFDLAVSTDPSPAAKEYAKHKKAGFVVLDADREIARIVKGVGDGTITVDLARFRDSDLEADLRARDFTVNAMAVQLVWPLLEAEFTLCDPLGGWQHLQEKRLVLCSDRSFRDDPLRLMRAFRLAAVFGLEFDPTLPDLIQRDAPLLKAIASERIRDELFKTLAVPDSAKWIRRMSELGVLEHVLPALEHTRGVEQNTWHHLDVFDHTLLTLEMFEKLLADPLPIESEKKFRKYLNEPISGSRTYRDLFKFGCLLHDLGKPVCKREQESSGRVVFHGHEMEGSRMAEEIAENLKLSAHEAAFLMKIAKNHMRPGVIIQEGVSERRLFRYFSETGRDGVGIALMSLADRMSALGESNNQDPEPFSKGIFAIMADFYRQMEYAKQTPLVTGTDLITHFRLQPGPKFKEILSALQEAQHLGTVKTQAEAMDYVARLLAK